MPELPEVDLARAVIAGTALGRRIGDVDDTDTYVCRPHPPGEIRAALVGRRLTGVHRQGKSIWCSTSGIARSRMAGPDLGIHLVMSGRIFVTDAHGAVHAGGDPLGGTSRGAVKPAPAGLPGGAVKPAPAGLTGGAVKPEWTRFALTFVDGGSLRLFDKRRLGRIRLDPDLSALGPDARELDLPGFAVRVRRGTAPIKARLLDQSVLAGVGNLLADEALWRARVSPRRPAGDLSLPELGRLHAALGRAVESAMAKGGVHTGEVIAERRHDGHCPRCGAPMLHGVIGGRSTWWCSREQTSD